MRRLMLVFAALFASIAAAQTSVTFSPMSRSVSKAAYGKLPKDVQVWAIGVQGPLLLSEVRQLAVQVGYPVVAVDMQEGVALKARRTSWLSIFPAILRYGAWALNFTSDKVQYRVGLPAAATALSELLRYLPEQAAGEKFERLQKNYCRFELAVPAGQEHSCTILTLIPPDRKPQAFRLSILPMPAPDQNGLVVIPPPTEQ